MKMAKIVEDNYIRFVYTCLCPPEMLIYYFFTVQGNQVVAAD
jgi:hypothetical protein